MLRSLRNVCIAAAAPSFAVAPRFTAVLCFAAAPRFTAAPCFAAVLCFAAALCFAAGARAQEYTSLVVFGDSLSDSGNVAQTLGLPAGSSYTTNPDPVWPEILAQVLGVPGTSSLAGGSNYAFGGACADPDASCNYPAPGIGQQIDLYLSGRPSGIADPAALYAVWGGGNDLDTILQPNPGIARVDPQAAVPAAAQALAGHVRRLREAGARRVVVFNLPDLGATPLARLAALADPAAPGALTAVTNLYNGALNAALEPLGDGIVPINAFALAGEAMRDPAAFGLTDVQSPACSPVGPNANALVCGPAGSGSALTYGPETNRSHLFADLQHPTGAVHAAVGNVVSSTLAAPVQVSLAGEAGVETASAHWRAVSAEHQAELRRERPAGSWHGYASALFGRRQVVALPRLGEARADVRMATVGAAQRAAGDLWWGAAVSVAGHDNDVSGAALGSETLIGSVQGTWRRGGLYLSGAAQLGRSAIDIARSLRLGPSVRREAGGTASGQYGFDLDLGWSFHEAGGGVSQGLAAGVSWLVQEVDGYRENGNSSTAMNFSAFRRRSLALRAGYRISEVTEFGGLTVRPYAGLAYELELNDDPVSVTAGSNTMPGRFAAPGYAPPGDWLNVDIGMAARLDGGTHAVVGYSGRTGSGGRSDHLLKLGLRAVF